MKITYFTTAFEKKEVIIEHPVGLKINGISITEPDEPNSLEISTTEGSIQIDPIASNMFTVKQRK